MSDDEEYVSTASFSSTPLSAQSVENTYRMAQVLEKRGEIDKAIAKYLLVCDAIERIIALNPGANVEVRWAVLSLGNMADIYYERKDYEKSVAFRNCQNAFLEFIKGQKHNVFHDTCEDDSLENFAEVASSGTIYRQLFEQVHEAAKLPDNPYESPDQLLEKYTDQQEKENEEKIQKLIRLFEAAADEQEKEDKSGCCVRMLTSIADHPGIFCVVVILLTVLVMLIVRAWPTPEPEVAEDFFTAMNMWDKLISEYAKNMKKQGRTPQPRQILRPKTKEEQAQDDDVFSL